MDRFSIISRHTAGSALEVSPSLASQKAVRPFSLPAQQADPTHLNSAYPSNVPQARQYTSGCKERSRGNEGSRAAQGDAARPMPGEIITHALAQAFPACATIQPTHQVRITQWLNARHRTWPVILAETGQRFRRVPTHRPSPPLSLPQTA